MNKFVHYGFVLLIISAICATGLSFANKQTSPIIEKIRIEKEMAARSLVMPKADSFNEEKSILAEGIKFIPAYASNDKIGYVAAIAGMGYAGRINIMMGVDLEGKLSGINVISAQETPGLGDKIFEKDWQESWKGRDVNYKFSKEVDGFAGATVSPEAVFLALNRALTVFNNEVVN